MRGGLQQLLLIVTLALVTAVGSNMSSSSRRARSELTEIDSRMFGIKDVTFLTPNNTAQLAHTGSTVTLSCRLTKTPNFGMVTWSRRGPAAENSLQILSIGDVVHINDPRFLIAKKPQDNDWELRLVSVQSYDSGEYRCQATTHPPSFIATSLAVVDAFAEIQVEDKAGEKVGAGEEEVKGGAQEKFIKGGSQLRLNCHLRKATEPPAYIFWYHNKTMVNYSPDLGRAVYTHQDGMGSTLTISSVGPDDGGNYTCAPPNIHPHSVIISIMDTEGKYAAVYRDGNTGVTRGITGLLLLLTMFTLAKFC